MRRFFLFLLALSLFGCNHFDDLEGIETTGDDAEFAIPLVNTRASLKDLLESLDDYTFLDTSDAGLILLRYKGDIVTKTSDEIFANIQLALPPLIPVIDTAMALPFNTPEGVEIDYVELKTGIMQYTFVSYHEEDLTVKVKFPQAVKPDGEPLEFTHVVNYAGSTPVYPFPLFINYDLAGHKLIADTSGNLSIIYEAYRPNGERDTLSNFFVTVTNLTFEYAEGYFGNQIHDGERDTIFIEFFESWTQGDVYFNDPKIYVNVFNSFGVPTRSIVNIFDIYTALGNVLPLQADAIEDGIDFDYPLLTEVGEEKVTQFTFTKDNSNIDQVLGSKPIALDYDVDAITNPDSITAIRGFITDSSRYTVNVEVELPIYGRASGFQAIDTVRIDFSNFDAVSEVEFKLVTENNLPMEVKLQGVFIDEQGVVIDSLFSQSESLILAAPVDAEGEVLAPAKNTQYIPVGAEKFDRLRQAANLLIYAAFSTTENGTKSVKVYSDQDVRILMGMIIKTRD